MFSIENKQAISWRIWLRDKVRYFNRKFFNPLALCFAGRPKSFWSVIRHTGRNSGNTYITPIVAARQNDCFVIPLPYGRKVDWFQNVMAIEGCDLIYQGDVYHAEDPENIQLAEGIDAFSERVQGHLRRSDTKDCLRLNKVRLAPESEELYRSFTTAYPRSRGVWSLAAFGFLMVGITWLLSRRRCPICRCFDSSCS